MILRNSSLGPVSGDYRRAQHLGQLNDLLGAAQGLDFFTYKNDRPFSLDQSLPGPLNHCGVPLSDLRFPRSQHLHFGLLPQQVGGYLQFDGPGAPRLKPLERFNEVVWDRLNLVDEGIPVGHRFKHTQLVLGFVGRQLPGANEFLLHVGADFQNGRA